jgi:hypothetical protein
MVSLMERYRHKIKTPEELRAAREAGDHVPWRL